MNWKNERKVQKGAKGKEKTARPPVSLSLSLTLFLLLPFLFTGRLWGGGVHLVVFSDRHVFVFRKENVVSAGLQAHCHPPASLPLCWFHYILWFDDGFDAPFCEITANTKNTTQKTQKHCARLSKRMNPQKMC